MSIVLPFYNYSTILSLPTTVLGITTYLTHYGSYRTVEPFDLPTQNTITKITATVFGVLSSTICNLPGPSTAIFVAVGGPLDQADGPSLPQVVPQYFSVLYKTVTITGSRLLNKHRI